MSVVIDLREASQQRFRKPSRRIKLSKNLRPFVSRVVRDGRVQQAFANQIGRVVGGCVAANLKGKKGMVSGRQVHGIAKLCVERLNIKGTKLFGAPTVAAEYYEVD